MGKTKIEWAERTYNPVTGCTKTSPGCANCYAERMSRRLAGRCGYPKDNPFAVTPHPNRLDEPRHWKKPSLIFVCSMGDLFHDDVPAEFVTDVFQVMSDCSQHTFMLLTKRPENILEKVYGHVGLLGGGDYLQNVWYGVTAENQAAADARIPLLLDVPAEKRFVSCEPLLGPLNLTYTARVTGTAQSATITAIEPLRGGLDLVIVGGETGPGARPMDLAWARNIKMQCAAAGVPFFFKRVGGNRETPPDLQIREWPE
jgi:protein gp37